MSEIIMLPSDRTPLAPLRHQERKNADIENTTAELLDNNLAAFLLAGGVDVGGLMTLLNEYLDFTRVKENSFEPMEVLGAWYLRDGIGDFIERLRHDSGRIGKAANAAAVRKGTKALGEG